MKNLKFLFFFIICFSGLSCDSFSQSLPDSMPSDFKIYYREDGSMLPISKTIFISQDSSFIETYNFRVENKTYIDIPSDEIKKLYKFLADKKFENIRTYEETVYDRGGNSIQISWKSESVTKSNSGLSFIEDDWLQTYSEIVNRISELANSKLNKLKKDFIINIDTSIINSGKKLILSMDDESFHYDSEINGFTKSISTKIVKGKHFLAVNLVNPIDTNKKSTSYASEAFVINFNENQDSIKLLLKDKKIVLE